MKQVLRPLTLLTALSLSLLTTAAAEATREEKHVEVIFKKFSGESLKIQVSSLVEVSVLEKIARKELYISGKINLIHKGKKLPRSSSICNIPAFGSGDTIHVSSLSPRDSASPLPSLLVAATDPKAHPLHRTPTNRTPLVINDMPPCHSPAGSRELPRRPKEGVCRRFAWGGSITVATLLTVALLWKLLASSQAELQPEDEEAPTPEKT